MRLPYATRYLVDEYRVVGKIVSDDKYLDMPEGTFIGECIKLSHGKMNPKRARQIYLELMKDAGLTAIHSPMKSADDNGDHSWEYYVDGQVLDEEQYAKTAHTSYFAT
jgi:hypothetical protein